MKLTWRGRRWKSVFLDLLGHQLHPFWSQTTSFFITNYILFGRKLHGHQILFGQQLHISRSSKVGTLVSWRFWPRTRIISTRIRSKFDLVLLSSTSLKPLPLPLMITISIRITITITINDYHYPLPITSTRTRSKFGPLLPSSTTLKPLRSPLPITSTWILSNFVLEHASPLPHASLKPYLSSHTRSQILRDSDSQWLVMLSSRPEVTCFGPELTLVLTRPDRRFGRESLQGGRVLS